MKIHVWMGEPVSKLDKERLLEAFNWLADHHAAEMERLRKILRACRGVDAMAEIERKVAAEARP